MDLKEFNPDGVGVNNGSYYGLPFTPEEARLVLVSVPWDVTVSYGSGTASAPDALIEASTQLDLYDPSAPDAWRKGIATADIDYDLLETSRRLRADAERVIEHLEEGGTPDDERIERRLRRVNEGCAAMNENVLHQAREWLSRGKLVGLVGGDHSTPYGLIRAIAEHEEHFGILHIDAHCDLRDAYEGFEFSHASIMFNVLRDVPQVQKLVQAGVRDFCDAEAARAARDERISLFDARTLARSGFEGTTWAECCRRMVAQLPEAVYVSFDIDGLSIEHCPRTGTPVPGGLTFDQAVYLLECVAESGRRIVGFDLVEVVPSPEDRVDAIVGARMLYKLCGIALRTQPDNEPALPGITASDAERP